MRVAINLSARQLTRYDLVRVVKQTLKEANLPAECLELELTESMVMTEPENVILILGQLQALGIELSIDDFGTGYSSLSYLKRFPVTSLKIDQSFVRELDQQHSDHQNAAAITKAIISIGHSLDMKVIAEGVETEEQMSFLVKNGCDAMQGYLFSQPLPGVEFISLLQRETKGDGKFALLQQLCATLRDKTAPELVVDASNA
jgi:EAL domain-containing protein (putative c-di-GMP-specific phosphodiesterase class I)